MVAVEWNTWAVLYAAVAAGAVALAAVVLARILRRPAPVPAESTLAEAVGGASPAEFLARKVEDAEGRPAGETIGVDGDYIVLKHEGAFRAVPLALIRVTGDRLVTAAGVDWEEAARRGEAWRKAGETPVRYDAQGNPVQDE